MERLIQKIEHYILKYHTIVYIALQTAYKVK